ncbi:zf-CHY-domain-containing protein [Eremomyces bilateralis CBS 781.70]|uniref:Zf-CHY-domain-containing protein n=1 Tax=Eremomyces bilateralis CBS 781.70 TaxID=1392243 RepID=A0A6G1FWV2_9PEZI|nr:zf-CHY-domain-containing protein [Eremomyces bilateralis CBS 781.70]KAF1810182.1 zf-CHY-domain-containing protein [Eremomyces bilateralis CBS 781.70]
MSNILPSRRRNPTRSFNSPPPASTTGPVPIPSSSAAPLRSLTSDIQSRSTADLPQSLPEDDGMAALRAKIHAIRDSVESNDEKAMLMHEIMTERWMVLKYPHLAQAQSPASAVGAQVGIGSPPAVLSPLGSPTPIRGMRFAGSDASAEDPTNPYNVCEKDLEPSYRPRRNRSDADVREVPTEQEADKEGPDSEPTQLGCAHYKRNVKLQCATCQKWYPCRHCHNDAEPSHALPRHLTKNMLCMLCKTPQPAGATCINCTETTAYHYCDICKLWDDDVDKPIYHCADCGLCRRGEGLGKDFVHCKECTVCILIQHFPTHRCLPRATDRDCPICFTYMFTSSDSIVAMPCGHYLHQKCYNEYMKREYRCPICKRSAINMELEWRKLGEEIERQPMPDEYDEHAHSDSDSGSDEDRIPSRYRNPGSRPAQRRGPRMAAVRCNDCGSRSDVRFHWLGCKCSLCDSYNTDEITTSASGPDIPSPPTSPPGLTSGSEAGPTSPGSGSSDGRPLNASGYGDAEPWRPVSYLLWRRSRRNSETKDDEPGSRIPFSPMDIMQRFSRSLPPIRDYISADMVRELGIGDMVRELGIRVVPNGSFMPHFGSGNQAAAEGAGDANGAEGLRELDFWGVAGRFLSGDEDDGDDEDDEEGSSEEEEEDDDNLDLEDEGEADEEEDIDFELLGHR